MKQIITALLILFLTTATLQADLQEGDSLPNPTLESLAGEKIALHDLMDKVTVIHLWKAN